METKKIYEYAAPLDLGKFNQTLSQFQTARKDDTKLEVTVDDLNYVYYIHTTESLPIELQKFGEVGFPNGYLFISENIPEKYRPYFLAHEIYCISHAGEKGHCLRATEKELALVPKEMMVEYVDYRVWFYLELLSYLHEQSYTDIVGEVEQTLCYLMTKIRSLQVDNALSDSSHGQNKAG